MLTSNPANSPALPSWELQPDTDTSQPRGSSQTAPGWIFLLIHPCNKVSPILNQGSPGLLQCQSRAGHGEANPGKKLRLLLAQPPESPAQGHCPEPGAEAAGPGGSSGTREGKHRVENKPAPGNFVLFSSGSVFLPRLFHSAGGRVGFGWLILPGDPCSEHTWKTTPS